MEFGILYHPRKPESLPLAQTIARWLQQRGHQTWQASNWDTAEVHRRTAVSHLLIVLGGDGSILRAARCAVPYNTPLLGVNLGRIGFLAEAQPDNWADILQKFLDQQYWLEARLMLKGQVERNGELLDQSYMALNEFVISGTRARVVHLELTVDQDLITTYTADGLIAATPTGSTAYSMAAGGPLLPPELRNFLLLPVAPYLSLDRALVLHEEARATIRINSDQEAFLMADGQEAILLQNNDLVIIHKHEHTAQFVRMGQSSYFYRRLLRRLGFESRT
jgi:NAD+ kinase